jgi:MFS family permease
MLTPQQAYRLFVYADWAMLLVGLAMIVASISWGMYGILPRNKGRRRRILLRALVCLLVFAMFYGTQASLTIPFFNEHWTPLLIVLYALPVVLGLSGMIASVAYRISSSETAP